MLHNHRPVVTRCCEVGFKLILPLLLALLPCSSSLLSQTFSFQSYTIKDGLASNQVNCVFQDSRGYLWIGTNNGLSMYDGSSFMNYSVADGLTNSWISWITESRHTPGTMWFGSATGGICKFADSRITPEFPALSANNILEDRDGTLWCTTDAALYRIHDNVPEILERGPGSSILQMSDGFIWVAMRDRVSIYSAEGKLARTINLHTFVKHGITTLQSNGAGVIFAVATYDSLMLAIRDSTIAEIWRDHSGLPNFCFTDQRGDLWTRDNKGLVRLRLYDDAIRETGRYEVQDLLPGNDWVGPALLDREDNLWVGTWTNGLLKVTDTRVVRFSLIPTGGCGADSSGHVWSIDSRGLWETFKDHDGNWHSSFHRDILKENGEYRCPGVDPINRLWIVHAKPIEVFCYGLMPHEGSPSSVDLKYRFTAGKDFPDSPLMFVMADREERLWFSLDNVELYVIDLRTREHIRTFDIKDSLPGESIRALCEDRDGNIWAGDFGRGLAVLDAREGIAGKFRKFGANTGLPDTRIRAILQDRDGHVWVGTRYGGLAEYEAGKFRTLSVRDGLHSNSIWGIAEDAQDRLWLTTDAGMECVNRKTLQVLPLKPEFRGEQRTGFGCFGDKFLWSGSLEGIKVFEYVQRPAIAPPPPVYITSLRVKDRRIGQAQNMQLQSEQNDCTLEYDGLSYRDESAVRYQFRMLGIDTTWSPPRKERSVTYASLKPGTYSFEVKAINWDGVASASAAQLSFTILPPLWQRWWFRSIAVVLFLSLGPFVYYRRVSRLKRATGEQQELSRRLIESQERERKRIAAELHDSLGQNLLVIQNHVLLALDARPGQEEVVNRLNDISNITSQTIGEVREIAHNLRPYHLDTLGLTTSIGSILRRVSESSRIAITSDLDPIDALFSNEQESHIYRIFQEAVNNIVKHSQATEASVSIKRRNGTVSIIIRDNGKGFASARTTLPSSEESPHGFGLIGLGERVRILNGNLSFGSTPGRGTTLLIDIPFDENGHG